MSDSGLPYEGLEATGPRADAPAARRFTASAAVLLVPLAGLALLVVRPQLDVQWEHHPAHFWLVLAAAGLSFVLAYNTWSVARRRGDARVVLVSLSFLAAGGFLGLHALATPGVLLETSNAGFVLASPVGLLVSAAFAAASSMNFSAKRALKVASRAAVLLWALVLVMAGWALLSLTATPPFDVQDPPERASGPLIGLAAAGFVLFGLSVVRYLKVPRHPASPLPLAMAAAFLLLAEAEVAVAWGRNWHLSWWEWHVLMLAAFVVVAATAQRSWPEERWVGLYLPVTASSQRDVSVMFADLQGFTSFSERHTPQQVTGMLNAYFTQAVPEVVQRYDGIVDRFIGDAIMATFNTKGDQPDHAARAAGAGLALQEATARLAAGHPEWPRFRVGVNSGPAAVGVLGTHGGRTFTVIGDVVNVAARLEGHAPVGGVAIGAETLRRLPGAKTEPIGVLHVKGRADPVEAHRLVHL